MKLIFSLITANILSEKTMSLLQEYQNGLVLHPYNLPGNWKENPRYFPQNLFHIIQ